MRQEYTTEEQKLYALVLEKGMYIGLLGLLITFVIYATGLVTPYIPYDKLPEYWSMSAHEYLEAANVPSGWGWVGLLGYGDFLNFVGIAILAAVTILCYIMIVPILFKKGDKIFAAMAILEAIVLIAAASGLITGGH